MLGDEARSEWESTARFSGSADALINAIVIRSGYYPDGLDPELARPQQERSPTFLLDIDVDSIHDRSCEPDQIAALMRSLSERVQSLFHASQLAGDREAP